MALMAARSEITPMPDCAIFADTGWEPKRVYEWLGWLEKQLPFPVHRVSAGNLRDKVLSEGYSDVPFFTASGMGRRQCTYQFKLRPIRREILHRFGATSKRPVIVWVGISKDEVFRRKPSTVKYIINRWPLLELDLRRGQCEAWLQSNYHKTAPRSACCGCPFRNRDDWRDLQSSPAEWLQTVADDCAIRLLRPGVEQYMHASLQPLGTIDFSTAEDRGQLSLFNNECEGMCGV